MVDVLQFPRKIISKDVCFVPSALLGTLQSLTIYIALVVIGAIIGSRPFVRGKELPWLGRFQFFALIILITSLGVKLGANEEVISSLGTIGLSALLITVLAIVGSVTCVFLLRKFILKLNRHGIPATAQAMAVEDGEEAAAQTAEKADTSTTWWIVGAVILGMLAGRFLLPPSVSAYCGTVIDFGLYLLLFLVGLDMGKQGGVGEAIRQAGFGVLLVPLGVVIGTFAGAALAGVFLPMSIKDTIAASAGFGWYSLAPTLLEKYSLSVSAVAFLSNVMREIFAIVAIPVVARKVGFVECVSLPGAAAMDTVLPVVVGATSERITIYSFVSGVILSLAVPILVPAIVALPF